MFTGPSCYFTSYIKFSLNASCILLQKLELDQFMTVELVALMFPNTEVRELLLFVGNLAMALGCPPWRNLHTTFRKVCSADPKVWMKHTHTHTLNPHNDYLKH